jgi:uncharacterized caspase-like protein
MFRFSSSVTRLFGFIVVLGLNTNGGAQDPAPSGVLRYVAVGVSQYPSLPSDRQLRFAHKDAQDLARVWRSQEGKLCSKVEGVTLINNQATRCNILTALDDMIDKTQPGDAAMICLSGHGGCCGVRGEWGFLPSDYDDTNGSNTTVSATTLRTKLIALAHRGVTVVAILDCCYSGAFGVHNSDFVVFAACLPQETAREDAAFGNGLFTRALIEAMQGKADYNGDGVVTLAEVDAYVSSRMVQLLRDRREQNPSCGRPCSIRSGYPMAKVKQSAR